QHRRAGNGQNPRPHNLPGDAPAHGALALQGADTDDGAGDRVRGADRDAADDGGEGEGHGGAGFGAAAVEGPQPADRMAHGFSDAPAAEERAQAHGHVTGERWPLACVCDGGMMSSARIDRHPAKVASMRELLAELTDALNQGRECVYCAVVETRGSTPQK